MKDNFEDYGTSLRITMRFCHPTFVKQCLIPDLKSIERSLKPTSLSFTNNDGQCCFDEDGAFELIAIVDGGREYQRVLKTFMDLRSLDFELITVRDSGTRELLKEFSNPKLYPLVMEKYEKHKMTPGCRFESSEMVKQVMGYDFRTIRGFKDLSPEHKELAERLICKFINGFGLEYRETDRCRPYQIINDSKNRRFRLIFKEKNYSYLGYDGEVY